MDEILFDRIKPPIKKIESIPELLGRPGIDEAYLSELTVRKKNRIAVSIIGSMIRRKRLLDFLEMCSRLDSNYFVFVIGLLPENIYSDEEMSRIKLLLESLSNKDMLYQQGGYIEKESQFNSIFEVSDIVWLNYDEHPYTSNAIIKAMHFKTKVITNKNCLYVQRIADRYHFPLFNFEDSSNVETLKEWMTASLNGFEFKKFQDDFAFEVFAKRVRSSVQINQIK